MVDGCDEFSDNDMCTGGSSTSFCSPPVLNFFNGIFISTVKAFHIVLNSSSMFASSVEAFPSFSGIGSLNKFRNKYTCT